MKMKSFTFIALTCCILAAQSCNLATKTSENVITKDIQVSNFSEIEAKGTPDIIFSYGVPSVKIIGDEEAIEKVKVTVVGKVLKIESEDNKTLNLFSHNDDIIINISSPNINKIATMGTGDVKIISNLKEHSFTAESKGTGDFEALRIEIETQVKVKNSGTGDVSIKDIKATKSEIENNGTGDIEIKHIISNYIAATSNGTGDAALHNIVSDSISITNTGTGDFKLSGITKNANLTNKATGDILASNFTATNAIVINQGTGDVNCNVLGSIKKSAKGIGDINYTGNPKVLPL